MEQTLAALGGILVRAIPTFFLVLFLYVYLRQVIFKPLEKVLADRSESTEGARKRAAAATEDAARMVAEYEAAISAARGDIFREQDRLRKRLREEQTASVRSARKSADAAIREARRQLEEEAEACRKSLAGETESLAAQITQAILTGRRG